jgi:hypothetical protein
MQPNNLIRDFYTFFRRLAKIVIGKETKMHIDPPRPMGVNDADPDRQFSSAWFAQLYEELGDGTRCYRPEDTPGYGGGFLKACLCCAPNTKLHLLPHEQHLFSDMINDSDFKLMDHLRFADRKTIVCSKLGLCNGRKPFVCRTAPVYFVNGLMLYEESLCRLNAITYLNVHKESVEHIRSVVYRFQLENSTLGYGRNISTSNGQVHCDFEH